MITFELTITGTAPLLMHSSRLADPLDDMTREFKKVSSKRIKTDEDHIEMARLEHLASLYMVDGVGPYIPAQNIERSLVDAAKVSRQGVKVTRGVFITTDENPIAYNGPRDAEGLWQDQNFRLSASVKVGTARVMRCRPMFKEWITQATGLLDTTILNLEDLESIATTAGMLIGLGDWRPRYGRFTATIRETGKA